MSHFIFGGGGMFTTPDGKKFTSEEKARAHCRQERQRISEQIGRELTDQEWQNQQIAAAFDSRTTEQRMKPFQVKLVDEQSPLQRMIAKAEADVDRKNQGRERDGMTAEESILLTLKQRQARESEQAANDKVKAIHLKSVAAKLQALDELIAKENWSTESDAAFRQQLQQARETLIHSQRDPADLQERLQGIDEVLLERKTLRQAELLQHKAALEATLAQVDSEVGLLSEPEQPEFTPDPNGYVDPMAGYKPSDFQRVKIDRTQPLKYKLLDLQVAMFGMDESSEVHAAVAALKAGDSGPAEAVLAKYAR